MLTVGDGLQIRAQMQVFMESLGKRKKLCGVGSCTGYANALRHVYGVCR